MANSPSVSSASKQLRASLTLLKGGTDEQVFAGLLMLTKHVPVEEFQRFRGLILAEMQGGHFLRRVLVSGLAKDEANADLYLRIGLGVSLTFVQDQACARKLVGLLPLMEQVVMKEQGANGCEAELRIQALRCCLDILRSQKGLENPATFEDKRLRCPVVALADLFEKTTEAYRSSVFEPLFIEIQLEPADCQHLGSLYAQRRDDVGTSAARVLVAKLDVLVQDDAQPTSIKSAEMKALSTSIPALAAGVFQVLRSFNTAPDADRSLAFRVAEILCRVAGPGWPGLVPSAKKSEPRLELETNVKILGHLVAVEVTAQLTHLRYVLLESVAEEDGDIAAPKPLGSTRGKHDEKSSVDSKEGRLDGEEISKKVQEAVVCLHVAEHVINFLTRDEIEESDEEGMESEVGWAGFKVETLMALRQALIETFTAVTGFLELCIGAKTSNEKQFTWIVQSCARCTANWLKEETDESLEIRKQSLTALATLLTTYPEALINAVSPVLIEIAPLCTVTPSLLTCLVDAILASARAFTEALPETDALAYNQTVQIASFLIELSPSLVGRLPSTWAHGCVELLLTEHGDLALDVAGCLLCTMALAENTEALQRYTKRLLAKVTELSKQGLDQESVTFLEDTVRPYLLMRVLSGG